MLTSVLAMSHFQQEDEIGNYVNQEVELFSPLDLLSVARQIALGMVSV